MLRNRITFKRISGGFFSENNDQLIAPFLNCSHNEDWLPGFKCELNRNGVLLLMERTATLNIFLSFIKDTKIV